MSEVKTNVSNRGAGSRPGADEEVGFLRKRVAELEERTQQLYQQNFLLQQRLSASDLDDQERAEFISHVAHELRTPLTSIKGYVDLVLEGETGLINDMQREFLGVVGLNTEKLARIIGELLDVSRLEAGQMNFRPMLTDFQNLVTQTCAEVRPQLETKDLKFEVHVDETGPLPASLDPERFGQALRAIIAYAGQVTPPGGTVYLEVGRDETGELGQIKVEDEGPGIAPEEVEQVFNKFWRPQSRVWREGADVGLGLAIARSIIDIHEGTVRAANRPAPLPGSMIIITIPLLSQAVAALTDFGEEEIDTDPHYAALVITQNPDFGRVMQETLGQGGFQIIIASDRSELVSDTPSWQPDLIINNGAEPDLLREEDSAVLGPALKGAAILTLNLSPVEQRVIAAGAKAVLPWPASDRLILDNLEQTLGSDKKGSDLNTFKTMQTILLVSPSADALRSLDRLLREAGYTKVYRAMREADALTLARRYRPNWLLLDVPDPLDSDLDTPTLFEELRQDQLLSKTPTVVFLRPDQIAPDPSPDYRPNFVGKGNVRRVGTGELKARRSGSGELRLNPDGSPRPPGTDELKGLYYNVVPKPFLQKRLLKVARRLAGRR